MEKARYLQFVGQNIRKYSLVLFFFGFLANIAYASTDIQGIRISNQDKASRVVFDMSAEAKTRVFTLSNPNRVVIDLFDASLHANIPQIIDSKLIKSIRSGTREGNNLRVVLDMASKVSTKSFTLKSDKSRAPRFVLDLKAEVETKPSIKKPAVKPSQKPSVNKEPIKIAKQSKANLRDVVIAIDAGHGGKDPGALGYAGSQEKHVTLQIARVLAKKINKQEGMKAVLIRDNDVYISLRQRLNKARKYKADLFLSIHADAFHDHSASGSSVYALSLNGASSEAAAWLAQSSNSHAELMGGVSLDNKDDVVASVLLNLSQRATIQSSLEVGDYILEGMGKHNRLHKGHVQQAGFVVLKSPDIPSVLIETAFLSNPKEERKLRNKDHQHKIANAITTGVKKYFMRKAPPGTFLAESNLDRQTSVGMLSQ